MIAHVDADAFFASVLQRKHPHLKGKALLALGMGGGCVIAASYEAKAKGVKTGMRWKDAKALCPEALSVPSDFRETALASEQLEQILRDHCPVVEKMSIDEWFLDLTALVGGVPADLAAWARGIQKTTLDRTALSVSVGVAPSKLLAKMASEYHKPAGVTVVTHTSSLMGAGPPRPHESATVLTIEAFLRDRPAAAIPGIGHRRRAHTDARGWASAWDIASTDPEEFSALFGKNGREMQRELRGECVSKVTSEAPLPKSVSRCRSFRATHDAHHIWGFLLEHLSYDTLKMRRHGLACRGVSAWVRDHEYRYWSAHQASGTPLTTEEGMLPLLQKCFTDLRRSVTSFTQAGVGLWQLSPAGAAQFSLFRPVEDMLQEQEVQQSLDVLRRRFGRGSIIRGSALTHTKKKPVSRARHR